MNARLLFAILGAAVSCGCQSVSRHSQATVAAQARDAQSDETTRIKAAVAHLIATESSVSRFKTTLSVIGADVVSDESGIQRAYVPLRRGADFVESQEITFREDYRGKVAVLSSSEICDVWCFSRQ